VARLRFDRQVEENMSETFKSENLKVFFSYPFEDKKWQGKLAVATALMFANFIIPVLPILALYGYVARIIRQVVEGTGKPILPEWEDWGDLLLTGLKVLAPMLVFSLPFIALMIFAYGSWFFPALFAGLAAESGDMGPEGVWVILTLLSTGLGLILFGLAMLLAVLVGVLQPVIMCHVAVTNQFSAAFRIGEWWRIFRSNLGEFLLAYVFIVGLSIGVGLIYQFAAMTVVLCCILPILLSAASVYLLLVMAPMFAQVYRGAVAKSR
jgi:hypothetical protein